MTRYTKADVRKAFELYQEVTGDRDARLQIESPNDGYGTRYRVINARYAFRMAALGAADAWAQIHRYVDGWRDAERHHRVGPNYSCPGNDAA